MGLLWCAHACTATEAKVLSRDGCNTWQRHWLLQRRIREWSEKVIIPEKHFFILFIPPIRYVTCYQHTVWLLVVCLSRHDCAVSSQIIVTCAHQTWAVFFCASPQSNGNYLMHVSTCWLPADGWTDVKQSDKLSPGSLQKGRAWCPQENCFIHKGSKIYTLQKDCGPSYFMYFMF